MTLHIILWLWKGWRPVYDRRDVAYIARQLQAYGDLPPGTRILCLTDFPEDWHKATNDALGVVERKLWPELLGLNITGIPSYPWLPAFKSRPNCFRRLKVFAPEIQASLGILPGDLVMSMDLDSIVRGPVMPLLAPLLARVHRYDFVGMGGHVARIHGSLFAFRAGTCEEVWTSFDPRVTPCKLRNPDPGKPRYIGSDQAHLSTVLPDVPLWGTNNRVYSFSRHYATLAPKDPVTYMSFAGNAKPRGSQCALHLPWIHEHAMRHWEE